MKQTVVDTTVISDPLRVTILAQRLNDGRILVRTPGKPIMIFSADEIDRLAKFAAGLGTMQRFSA